MAWFMKTLVVDSTESDAKALARRIEAQGHQTVVVGNLRAAMSALEDGSFDIVFAEAKGSGTSELEFLRHIRTQLSPTTEVVMMSEDGSIEGAASAIRLGALEFLTKPLTAPEIAALITRVELRRARATPQAAPCPPSAATPDTSPEDGPQIVGQSAGIDRVRRMIKVASRTDANVLIYGETGTGKDLVASVIHNASHRSKRPFVKVGCALLPESLIESELYGHEEGSFTGADQHRRGRFELAEGGTIYLDDVDDIPLTQQAKLLRVIEEKVFERVGGSQVMRADVRIVASTKQSLLHKVGDGSFRSDLYYRLDVLRILIPPLRDRRDDIPSLTDHLLERIAGNEDYHIDPQAVVLLAQHDWPGNVRELLHTLERAYLVGGGRITAELIENELVRPPSPDEAAGDPGAAPAKGFRAVMDHAERQLLASALEAAGGNKTAAAQALGMKPSTFRDRLAKHGLG